MNRETDTQTDRHTGRQTPLITQLDDWSVTEKEIFKSKLITMFTLYFYITFTFLTPIFIPF